MRWLVILPCFGHVPTCFDGPEPQPYLFVWSGALGHRRCFRLPQLDVATSDDPPDRYLIVGHLVLAICHTQPIQVVAVHEDVMFCSRVGHTSQPFRCLPMYRSATPSSLPVPRHGKERAAHVPRRRDMRPSTSLRAGGEPRDTLCAQSSSALLRKNAKFRCCGNFTRFSNKSPVHLCGFILGAMYVTEPHESNV